MIGIITFVHVLVSVLMIMVILLQTGKGAEIGAAFGGGYSQTLFGSSGPVGFLNKLTTVVATFFMVTSLLLGLVGRTWTDDEVLGGHGAAGAAAGGPNCPGSPRAGAGASKRGFGTKGLFRYNASKHVPKWWNLVDTPS